MSTREDRKWERMRQMLAAGAAGEELRPVASQRTLFGIKSSMEQQLERIVAEDEARRRFAAQPRKAFVFDLDGTLLNTLPDLVAVTNATLCEAGWPARSADEIRSFVGNGLRMLLVRATAPDVDAACIEAMFERWQVHNVESEMARTQPYPDMPEALATLKEAGCKLGVVSNKVDAATQLAIGKFFPGVFDAVHGEAPGFPRKPDPAGLLRTLEELGVAPQAAAYAGDSPSDVAVARAAGVLPVAVSWGYRSVGELRAAQPAIVCSAPGDLTGIVARQ